MNEFTVLNAFLVVAAIFTICVIVKTWKLNRPKKQRLFTLRFHDRNSTKEQLHVNLTADDCLTLIINSGHIRPYSVARQHGTLETI